MSLFQCQNCGCCENTALSHQGFTMFPDDMDWTGIEDRKGKKLCSACGPAKYAGGAPCDKGGGWHGRFERIFLPKGEFKTNRVGNLEHIESGSENYRQFAIAAAQTKGPTDV